MVGVGMKLSYNESVNFLSLCSESSEEEDQLIKIKHEIERKSGFWRKLFKKDRLSISTGELNRSGKKFTSIVVSIPLR